MIDPQDFNAIRADLIRKNVWRIHDDQLMSAGYSAGSTDVWGINKFGGNDLDALVERPGGIWVFVSEVQHYFPQVNTSLR
jgi:hypothetical protein